MKLLPKKTTKLSMDKTTKKILIRIGMFVIYLLIGGAVFQAMEKKNHDQLREEYFHKINEFVEKYNVSEYDMAELEHLIQCNGKHDAYTRWTFGNSVVFSGTIVSTVGKFEQNFKNAVKLGYLPRGPIRIKSDFHSRILLDASKIFVIEK